MRYILLLGGNVGNVAQSMDRATELLEAGGARVVQKSGDYESEPWGFESANMFVNRVIEVESRLNPFSMLDLTQATEQALGRTEKTGSDGKYADRNIDIDILFCDNDVMQTSRLTIPHPRLHLRMFTLRPLMEHWSQKVHPRLWKTIAQLYEEQQEIERLKN